MEPDDPAWSQATLPVQLGGLGICSAADLAPSVYLSSTAAFVYLVHCIVPPCLQGLPLPHVSNALTRWSMGHDQVPPDEGEQHRQRSWDEPRASALAESLLKSAPDPRLHTCLLASLAKESRAWLNVLPISMLGLSMDDNTIRVAAGLRLGALLCRPHSCTHCGEEVDSLATHGLSCRWSEGRHHRHAEMNDIMKRALTSAKIPSRLEPSGLHQTDGKRPDGVTVVPWRSEKLLIWNVTYRISQNVRNQ